MLTFSCMGTKGSSFLLSPHATDGLNPFDNTRASRLFARTIRAVRSSEEVMGLAPTYSMAHARVSLMLDGGAVPGNASGLDGEVWTRLWGGMTLPCPRVRFSPPVSTVGVCTTTGCRGCRQPGGFPFDF
eukprot:GHVO01067288.1.p1 GENE.GHVO01067288.1~~GHVO01067288.1.p1  ORF type:complete len:129 (-),score=17.31 GHVO01067288.1:63-449(-)